MNMDDEYRRIMQKDKDLAPVTIGLREFELIIQALPSLLGKNIDKEVLCLKEKLEAFFSQHISTKREG